MRTEVLMGGLGGQGVRLIGQVLGEACVREGKRVATSASYGPEQRGSLIRTEVVVSDGEIDYPRVLEADFFVAMAQGVYDLFLPWDAGSSGLYLPGVARQGVVLFDPSLVTSTNDRAPQTHLAIPAAQAASELGSERAANMVMLGALAAVSGLVSRETLRVVVGEGSQRFVELNLRGLEKGFELSVPACQEKEFQPGGSAPGTGVGTRGSRSGSSGQPAV